MPRDDASNGLVPLADIAPLQVDDLLMVPALLRLTGPAGDHDVEPMVMRLLLQLAGRPGIVMSRAELMGRLWPNSIVADDSLHRLIALARKALAACGTTAAIETIPRTGYRLVVAADLPLPGLPAAGEPAPARAAGLSRRWVLALAGVAGAAGLGLIWRGSRPPPRAPRVARLAAEAAARARLAEPSAEQQGVGLLREAVRLAPQDAGLWGQLALALRGQAEFSRPPRVAATLAESETAARRALALDPGEPDARAALVLQRPFHGNWWPMEQGFLAILQDVPDHLPSLDGLAQLRAGAGLLKLHYGQRQRTVALDPLHAGYNFRSIYAHWMNGNLAAADRAGARGLELWPRHFATWNARMGLFAMSGRPERALAMLEDGEGRPDLPPPYAAMLMDAVTALADGSPAARARGVEAVTARVAQGGPFLAVIGSMMLAELGAADLALQVVEGFLLERGPFMVESSWRPGQILHNDVRRRFTNFLFTPVMAPVHALPGFAAITRGIGLDAYWQQSGHRPEHLGRG